MRHIRLFNCKDQVEYRFNGSVSVETVYEIKKNAELYFSIKPLVENKIFPNINNPDFLALDKDGLPVVVLFQQDDNACVLSILEYYMELPKEDLDVDWQGAGVICLSEDFHPYDIYLAAQSKRKIELIRYESYPNDLILFETIFPKNKSSEFADLCGTINSTGLYSIIEIEQEAKKIHINLNTDPPSVTFSGADTNKLKAKGNIKGESKDKTVDKPKVKNKVWGIGYCKIQNNKHYAVFPNKDKVEIMDLPDAIYLAEGQFVLVDQYGKFKYVFGSMIENTFYKNEIECFALVVVRGNQTYMDKGDGIYRKFFNDTNIEIRNQTVISIDRNNRFVRYYKPVKFVADSFMSSVKAKGHQMVFVLDISSEGVLLRDVETGKEFTRKLNQENQKLQKHHILCLDQDRFITAFSASKFYTLSTFYKQLRYGTVEIEESNVFLNEFNGERIMINNPPDILENGNIVCVDELNQYCGSVTHEEHENISYSGKNLNSKENTKKKEKSDRQEKIEIKGKALVLGNNAYANSYRLSLLKCGYYANVLEGYEPWAKIKTMMRGVDIIVVVTSHISHENMQRIKKEVNDIPVIYSEFDGANRVQTQILVKLRESSLTGNA